MELITNPKVDEKFNSYPEEVKGKLLHLRQIILDAANKTDYIKELEETLKWGEPSYLAKKGSTVRIDWKKKTPDQYAIYFKCTSKLVSTFRALYKDDFQYENNRAIIFKMDDAVPEKKLSHCVSLALSYHNLKHLPLLGAKKT